MPKFIIGYGFKTALDVIEAPTLDEALMKATERSMLEGCLDDDLADTTFAEPYTEERADEYGLTTPEEPTMSDREAAFLMDANHNPREDGPAF